MKDDIRNNDENCEPLPLRASVVEKPVGLNKKAILIVLGTLSIIVLFIAISSLTYKRKVPESKNKSLYKGTPNSLVSELPKSYTDWKNREEAKGKLKEITPINLKPEQSAEDKLLNEYRLKKLKQKLDARESAPSFESLNNKVSKNSKFNLGLNGSNEADGTSSLNPRDDASRQDEKNNFLNKNYETDFTLYQRLKKHKSNYIIQSGTIIPGLLLTGINSDLPGQILGQVRSNVYDSVSGNNLVIPYGTKVLGTYDSRIVYGQERALIVWTRLMFPDGRTLSLEGMPGVDVSGYAGLKDKVNNHYMKLLSGVLFGSILGAGAQVANGQNRTINPSFSQLALEGSANNINQAGQEITRKNLNIQPTIEIRPGTKFSIFVTKDVELG